MTGTVFFEVNAKKFSDLINFVKLVPLSLEILLGTPHLGIILVSSALATSFAD